MLDLNEICGEQFVLMVAAAGELPAIMKKEEFLGILMAAWAIIDSNDNDNASMIANGYEAIRLVGRLDSQEFSELKMLLQGAVLGQKIQPMKAVGVWDEFLVSANSDIPKSAFTASIESFAVA
ncbi:hypothetical protein CU669_03525 [Paramagnetospirillum kuznetsovii]|uniref:Uncharacterized protein n=1 Tax=Paramagnetospirillum kuznetsovii TaxID=2053833 RepID=A0A364P246_9PROT|nr:hypothetical protein [Paramagnetospirillum kuznetsovii]RAU23237.1 hypothetical protein CU669_03525 [Paramagnetospirillum kuznetsovii]